MWQEAILNLKGTYLFYISLFSINMCLKHGLEVSEIRQSGLPMSDWSGIKI